jgi:hypothetical protein
VASGFPTPSDETDSRESSISRAAKLATLRWEGLEPINTRKCRDSPGISAKAYAKLGT